MKIIKQNMRDNLKLLLPLGAIFLYIAPLIWYGENSFILIHDNLDSNIIYYKVLAESGLIFGSFDAVIPNIMNGLPRNAYGSEFNVILWLYYFFGPFNAYVINQLLMRLFAFLGMFLLLKNHFLKEKHLQWITLSVALMFSLLPFWPSGGLTVAGQPLALYALLNFRAGRQNLRDWLIVSLVPLYASLVLSFLFFIFAIFMLWLYDWIIGKKSNERLLLAIAVMLFVFLIVEYRLVFSMLFYEGYISHRSDFQLTGYGIIDSLKRSLIIFRFGQYHAHSLHQHFITWSVLMTIIVAMVKSIKIKLILVILLIIGAISFFYGFWGWKALLPLRESLGVLSSFQITRFHFLNPLLWYITFALSLNILYKHIPKYGRHIVFSLIILQTLYLFYNHDQIQQRNNPTFGEFFSVDLFQDIDDYIGKEKESYRIVSIGLHPSISQYNGFYTLDAYMANYPLEYKKQFRKIIDKELEKNESIRYYFDNWGSRCYVFTDELGIDNMVFKESGLTIKGLELNTKVLYDLGGKYVFSAVEILNSSDNDIKLLDIFESDFSPWRIYLYKVDLQ